MNTVEVEAQRRVACRVVVVDDHEVVRKGLADLIGDEPDFVVCGESGTAAGAQAVIATERPDVAIVDIRLGEDSGLALVGSLAAAHPELRVLVLSAHDEMLFAERAFKAGAHGYIMKTQTAQELLAALRHVAAGKTYASSQVSERVLETLTGRADTASRSPVARLSDRERDVFVLVGQGVTTRDIATRLDVSVKTVESHYARIKAKLGLSNGRELVRTAVSWTERESL